MDADKKVLRILDANFNRSREGLRVCEEIFRFFLNDAVLTRKLKKARHDVTKILKSLPVPQESLVAARDVRGDQGKKPSPLENSRRDVADLFLANMQRSKESLRALEEFAKFLGSNTSVKLKKLRFEVYAIEKRALPTLETLRHHRFGEPKKRPACPHGA